MSLRKSGLQREVLALYRRALTMVRSKPPETRPKFLLFVRYTFHTNASKVPPRNVSAIEHLLRKGKRQIEMYEDAAVKDCWVSGDMLAWEKAWKTSTG
ncbi:putative complex I LYR family protein [Lyophyllum shimeji]|uniref:Complex I LYR family protein n=1 Tax=Lyophyllum shimeji TaxID=47721 RepID=A0A9P3UKN4_LYOSH|nr:putative complex I LYR family protein [Lyophyllum shimeji]